ncbi:MAG TPA: sterol desaturase family protein [Acidimicrobiales bacterium]|nr:sterol desaturase family protein [Acidimicrobiales bacterium]
MTAVAPPPPPRYQPDRPPVPTRFEHPATTAGSTLAIVATGLLVVVGLLVRSNLVFGIVVLAAIFIPIERLASLHPQKVFRAMWKTDLVHLVVNNLLATIGLVIAIAVPIVALRATLGTGLADVVRAQPFWLQFVEALLVAEVAGYWAHRATHRVPWLWRFHKVHHSISEMDWLAAGRLHPIDQVFVRSCVILPLVVLGFSRTTFGAYLLVATLWAIFIHANVRFTFGPLRWIIATPAYHHWHHTNDDDAVNRNFAGQLPLLDMVFGTFRLPKGRWPSTYGIDEPVPPTYLGQLAWPLHRGS